VVADQFAGGSSPVVGGGSSAVGVDGSSAVGGAGSSVVGGGPCAAGVVIVVVDGSSAAGGESTTGGEAGSLVVVGDDASAAGGGGDVSPSLPLLGAEDSSGVVSWAEPSFCSLSEASDPWLFSSRCGSCCSLSLSAPRSGETRCGRGAPRDSTEYTTLFKLIAVEE
jgi:hypothetical protein